MDNDLLQHLRELSLEDGKALIRAHADEITDYTAFGELLAEEALTQLYDTSLSLKLAELLIFFGEHVSHAASHALGLKAKGDALVQIVHFQAAMECLDAAGEAFLALGDRGNWARTRISWMTACAWLGNVEAALAAAEEARNVFLQLNEYYWACVIDHNTAMIYDYVGQYQNALTLYESMLATYPTITNQRETSIERSIALAEMNLGIHLAWFGKFEQAYSLQQQAQSTFITLEETDLIIYAETQLASLDYAQGYYGSALRRYFQARDILLHSTIHDPLLLAELKLWIATCLVKLHRSQEACPLAQEAVEMYREFGLSLNTGIILREYAGILIASHRLQEALAALQEAERLFTHGGFTPYASVTQLQEAEILLKLGFTAQAYEQAYTIKDYFEKHGMISRAIQADLLMINAVIESFQRSVRPQEQDGVGTSLEQAVALCKRAVLQARHYNLQEEAYKIHYLLGRLLALQGKNTKAAKHYGAAIVQIERILDDLVYDLSPSFLHTTWEVYEDMIALCLRQCQFVRAFNYLEQARSIALRHYLYQSHVGQSISTYQQEGASPYITQAKSAAILRMQQELKNLQEHYRDYSVLLANIDSSVSPTVDRAIIQTELKHCETKISEVFERLSLYQVEQLSKPHTKEQRQRTTKQVDLKDLHRQLAPDQLVLTYFLSHGRLVIFAVTAKGVFCHEVQNGMEQLEHLLPLLHAHLQPGGWPDVQHPPQKAIRRLLHRLYQLLIAPATHFLPSPSGSLTIVPYGPLHNLPFHALYDGTRFLIEDFQINYLPASNMLTHVSPSRDEHAHALVHAPVAPKQPLVFGYSAHGFLRHASDEAQELAALLNGRSYLEGDATIAKLIEQAPGSPVIHIATHGHSRLDAPNFSYVLLADGQLNAIDAFTMDLKHCELVTLSGCETGLSLSGGGDEQLGLGRAFLAAGARSLVMSLWNVEDGATSTLMRLFYQHLLHGESKVQALRAAQCHFLHAVDAAHSHPYYWAAFRLVGDGQPLHITGQNTTLATSALKR